ncbi:hypothetical protein K438DRAFT_1853398, partial [Mycena galopus ATCC 62051]
MIQTTFARIVVILPCIESILLPVRARARVEHIPTITYISTSYRKITQPLNLLNLHLILILQLKLPFLLYPTLPYPRTPSLDQLQLQPRPAVDVGSTLPHTHLIIIRYSG